MKRLQAGDLVPDFTATDQHGKTITLSDFSGEKLIIYFYPKDNTPGCTAEACNLRDNYALLQKKGFKIIGISADSEKSHRSFSEKFSLPFPLIADTDKELITRFGVWGPKKFMGREYKGIHRITFIIDENGVIRHVIDNVKTKDHTAQILDRYPG
ncbi:MAG: thioredoxin-dependent thiol peroxidase [Bacteroidia bacterium]|nr:thioredoxin-dependent thiol peroxidase [Bacteroidales bacterium]NCD42835.1 thioredoxin-dependent thiol peroxidase [Bacteroidia bacterium]MDD2324030.1 thioredoxin-dependent thiol peroxidase [Bacteroidales bacterium]MDD3010117.1 thioredoxin-dependent thiol peroxidase [Bacteroidales bacterium]MDD3962035.1 thioredoxin-dependent thiol peroxidase [Bacteroidales bacterium]